MSPEDEADSMYQLTIPELRARVEREQVFVQRLLHLIKFKELFAQMRAKQLAAEMIAENRLVVAPSALTLLEAECTAAHNAYVIADRAADDTAARRLEAAAALRVKMLSCAAERAQH